MAMSIDDIENDLLTYADFEEVSSVERARLFITAAKRWLILSAESSSNKSSSLSIGKSFVSEMMQRAQNYVSANAAPATGGRGRVRFLSAEGFRG